MGGVSLKTGSRSLRLSANFVIQLGSRCCGLLLHIPINGYDVCGDSILGRRSKRCLSVLYVSVYICSVVIFPVNFLRRSRALLSEILDSNIGICSSLWMVGGQHNGPICGRSPLYMRRHVEVVLWL